MLPLGAPIVQPLQYRTNGFTDSLRPTTEPLPHYRSNDFPSSHSPQRKADCWHMPQRHGICRRTPSLPPLTLCLKVGTPRHTLDDSRLLATRAINIPEVSTAFCRSLCGNGQDSSVSMSRPWVSAVTTNWSGAGAQAPQHCESRVDSALSHVPWNSTLFHVGIPVAPPLVEERIMGGRVTHTPRSISRGIIRGSASPQRPAATQRTQLPQWCARAGRQFITPGNP